MDTQVSSSEENQVNTLIYCMGDEADVLHRLNISADQRGTYQGVRDGCQVKENVIYECAKFNMRRQGETRLWMPLSQHCMRWQSTVAMGCYMTS